MTLALAFWILMLICLVFGVWAAWPAGQPAGQPVGFKASGGPLLHFILLVLLGWQVFGAPLHS